MLLKIRQDLGKYAWTVILLESYLLFGIFGTYLLHGKYPNHVSLYVQFCFTYLLSLTRREKQFCFTYLLSLTSREK